MIPERTAKSQEALDEFCQYLQKNHDVKNMVLVEIGSWTGLSALIFAKYFKEVVCIDRWQNKGDKDDISSNYDMEQVEAIFDSRIKNIKNIVKIKGDSVEELNKISKKIDICYIDSNHSYEGCKRDLMACKEKCKIITGHDYNKKFPGVIKAVNQITGKPKILFPDGSWIAA